MFRTLAIMAIICGAPQAYATPIAGLYGTGLADDGSLLSSGSIDTHYSLISAPGGLGSLSYATLDTGYPQDVWSSNTAGSQWISPLADQNTNMPGGEYDYQTTFTVNTNPSLFSISGQLSADDELVDVLLNGVSTGVSHLNAWATLLSFSLASGFVSGVNTLDFVVSNNTALPGAGNATGLQVQMAAQVPEPASALLSIIGFACGLLAWRKRT